ncbi:61c785a2-e795-4c22-bbd1-1f53a0e52874 [Sclerotinia trifoliorum]|uniref:Small acidic protein n=1 Tax=Sclerotinia trifoliorum TaxID=28548 RepID=A0A8H2ZQS4_9HELO|nr:61c785a2-e795-4c22-bbd1-1f53a0e52874 [Sclerotinia trifoliorum]
MEASANFIPLGGVGETFEFDQPMKKRDAGYRNKSLSSGKPKVIGATKEERSRIAREVRLAAKKEKKKAKSDAKKARKLNGILTRRATRNPEKYNKNKERNRLHAIDVERYKIRLNAVNQAQRLAAVHDPSGVSFNVGEVVTLEDGTVKSKKSLERKQELAAGKKPIENEDATIPEGVNPERLKLLEGEKKSHISKTALKKKKMYEPKPVPPKPIIPEGISLPEGEENWLALWDISDGQIEQRIAIAKRDAGNAKRDLRRQQREEARFRRMMKAKRRTAQKMGVTFDPVQAKNEILGDNDEEDEEASDSEAETNPDSDSDSDSDSDNGDDSEETKAKKAEEKKQKPKFNLDENQINSIVKREIQRVKKDTRRQEKAMGVYEKEPKVMTEEEKAALKEARVKRKAEKKLEKKAKKEEEAKLGIAALKGKQNRKARKELRRAERAAKETSEAPAEVEVEESKKRKRSKEEKESSKRKKSKSNSEEEEPAKKEVAAQWNADALDGDAERKSKFLRLLGAGKGGAVSEKGAETKGKGKGKKDIEKVQSELERQYDYGMKMKHDGGAKRRGLGA